MGIDPLTGFGYPLGGGREGERHSRGGEEDAGVEGGEDDATEV